MPVIALQGFKGSLHIVVTRLQDETDLIERRRRSKVIDEFQVELDIIAFRNACHRLGKKFLQRRIVEQPVGNIDEFRVSFGNHSSRLPLPRRDNNLYVEFFPDALLQIDVDPVLLDILTPSLQGFRGQVAQYFQLIIALTDQRAQCNGDGQAGHPRSGDADSHGIFQDIRAQERLDAFRLAAELFCRSCRAECYGHRLRTTNSRNNFLVNQRNDALPGRLIDHLTGNLI